MGQRWRMVAVLASFLGTTGCQLVSGFEQGRPTDGSVEGANTALAGLSLSRGELEPPFSAEITEYTVNFPLSTQDLTFTAVAAEPTDVVIAIEETPTDSGVESAPIALHLGDNTIEIVVTPDSGSPRVYSVVVSRGGGIEQAAYVKASNTEVRDHFASSVILHGDTLVVGAPDESSDATAVDGDQSNNAAGLSGAVYVFTNDGQRWSQQAYIKASNTGSNDRFGSRLAFSGDTLVVSAPRESSAATGINANEADNSQPNAGAVYVFTRNGTIWTQQAYIKPSNTNSNDDFGSDVSIDGDTLVVAARFESSAAVGVEGDQSSNDRQAAGAAYVFVRSGTEWLQQAYLKASNTDSGDRFGSFVAVSGDTIAVGAVGESSTTRGTGGSLAEQADNSAAESGAVYVFTRNGANWSQQQYIKASNTGAGDLFGTGGRLLGDRLFVGAPGESSASRGVNAEQEDDSQSGAGAVYVFNRSGPAWSQEAYIKASNAATGHRFGRALAAFGDALVVGARRETSRATGVGGDQGDNGAGGAGAAYLLTHHEGTWTQVAYIKASNTDSEDLFGEPAISGDTIAIGASGEASNATGVEGSQDDNSLIEAGAVYVFE